MKLIIISHTEHFIKSDGTLVGLGSTVTEINHLLDIFDTITHVAMLHKGEPPSNALPYSSERIKFVALPAVGGQSLADKLRILNNSLKIIKIVKAELKKGDCFQFRAPTGIGVFIIPYVILFQDKIGWFKYAGNWKQKNPPLASRFQRWLLKNQQRSVTINGLWHDQPKQCLSFENPCLTDVEVSQGETVIANKHFDKNDIHLCFVGRLEDAKGLSILIEGINLLNEVEKRQLKTIHIIGDGPLKDYYIQQSQKTGVQFKFYGLLARSEVHDIYKQSHAIVLPSASEGFPKVIAEAMNYGCLPIVSNVSAISLYVLHKQNGYLLNSIDSKGVHQALKQFLQLTPQAYLQIISSQKNEMKRFTYNYYNKRIVNDIL
ncbi:glycosyltransferase [Hanstruepera ponticola]|uniref:glycosyltransferase n=1 Tax=Hanstruepera ponticola TaxID=2042995 RepID=UPI000CF158B0|nr:glycosyltransferase [Hanstruepera ponticola]